MRTANLDAHTVSTRAAGDWADSRASAHDLECLAMT